jgi:gas vesicle protein
MKDIFYFILGAAVGAIFALLFAPQSGEELRTKLQDAAEQDWQKTQAQWKAGQEKTNQRLDQIHQTLQKQEAEIESEATEAA